MLRVCVIDFGKGWDRHLPLVKFSYNNSYHTSIKAALFEALYGRKCRSPICWAEVGDTQLIGLEVVYGTTMEQLRKSFRSRSVFKPLVSHDRQNNLADSNHKPMEFQVGDMVMLKVSPWKGVIRFGKRGKLYLRYIRPFKVITKVGPVSYRLELPDQLSHVHSNFHVSHLKKCYADEPLAILLDEFQIDNKLNFIVELVEIMDREVKQLKQSRIPIVRAVNEPKEHERSLVHDRPAWGCDTIQDDQAAATSAEIPSTYPDICIIDLYTTTGHSRGLGFNPRRGGFPSEAKKEWGLSLKAKVRVLHTAQLDVTIYRLRGKGVVLARDAHARLVKQDRGRNVPLKVKVKIGDVNTWELTDVYKVNRINLAALGWLLKKIHMTWAHVEKTRLRLRLYTKSLEEIIIQTVETASPTLATTSELDQDGNANPSPTNNPHVLPTALRAKVVQELKELQTISAYIDSRLENIDQFLNGFEKRPNKINMDDLEPEDQSVNTLLVSSFLVSNDDSDDGEVLNELDEYGNAGRLRRKKIINSLMRMT
nr:putative reverse transcriptase domain-containing protein [Tanacetum cinerariifolium]